MSSWFIRRANVIYSAGGRLPAEFKELAYLSSDCTAYIDTGISGGVDTLEITCDFKWPTFVAYGAVYGNYVDENHDATRIILSSADNKLYINNNSKCSNGTYEFSCTRNVRHTIVSSFGSMILDGTSMTTLARKGTSNNDNICLFNRSVINPFTVLRDIGLMIYAFSIKNNGVKVLDLVPAKRKSDNEVGMYDLVSDAFLTNAGSGSFGYGEL